MLLFKKKLQTSVIVCIARDQIANFNNIFINGAAP